MFIPVYRIRVGQHEFNQVHSVQVERSWQTLGDTAVIRIGDSAKRLKSQIGRGQGIVEGDYVSIELGYGGTANLHQEFTGYVTKVEPGIPITITCEDSVYLLRQMMVGKEFPGGSLQDMLEFLAKSAPYPFNVKSDVPDLKFGRNYLDYTVADFIGRFKKNYGLVAYFRGNTLFCGLRYGEEPGGRVTYRTDTNVIGQELTWRQYNAEKIRAVAVGTDEDGDSVEVFVGRKDARERIRLIYPGVFDRGSLRTLAERELMRLNYQGYEGFIETFGTPFCDHGWMVDFVDADFPNRSGSYYASKVVVTSGVGGYRRRVWLGQEVDWEPNKASDGEEK